jgi:hypothetical protein
MFFCIGYIVNKVDGCPSGCIFLSVSLCVCVCVCVCMIDGWVVGRSPLLGIFHFAMRFR